MNRLFKINKSQIILLILYSLSNTLFTLGILYIINSTFSVTIKFGKAITILAYFLIVIASYILNLIFQKSIIDYCYDFLYESEISLASKLLKIKLQKLNSIGTERIFGTITDIRAFIFLPGLITNTINSFLMILICMVYLFVLSITAAIFTIILILSIFSVYFFATKYLSKKIVVLNENNNLFTKFITDIIHGFKELKISKLKRDNLLLKYIGPNRRETKELHAFLSRRYNSINILNQYALFAIIGFIVFILPMFNMLDKGQIVTFTLTLLFLSAPINKLISMQNLYIQTRLAYKNISGFLAEINSEDVAESGIEKYNFEQLQFQSVAFKYNSSFSLEVNLSINKGEIIFIIGPNGSGKSTFINLLTGLHSPSQGKIILNGSVINNDDPGYQDLISAIYTDNYIFSHNYDNYIIKDNEYYSSLIKLMQMQHIIKDDREESVRRYFSKGQSKRVSLILALLEYKPVIVLDEWAADQDPYFRKYFYEKLIPLFKEQGKTIIAVTHDNTYFQYADRILKFEDGRVVKEFLKGCDKNSLANIF